MQKGRGHRRCSARVNLKDRKVTTDTTGEPCVVQKGKQVRRQRQIVAGARVEGSTGVEWSLVTTLGSYQQSQLPSEWAGLPPEWEPLKEWLNRGVPANCHGNYETD